MANNSGKISGLTFFIVGLIGMLIESAVFYFTRPTYTIIGGLPVQNLSSGPLLIFYGLIVIVIGFPAFIKTRKATVPSFWTYLFIFTIPAVFSIFGFFIAYTILKKKGLMATGA